MDKQNEGSKTCAYVVDSEYKIRFFNEALQALFAEVKIGSKCYECIRGMDAPCSNCPFGPKAEEGALYYSHKLDKWIEAGAADVDWPGEGPCKLVMIKEIREGNKNLLYNLTNLSVYEQLLELNLSENSYRTIYVGEDVRLEVKPEGALIDLEKRIADYLVHPDDRKRFLQAWNPSNFYILHSQKRKRHVLMEEVRIKQSNESYHWVQLILSSIRHNPTDQTKLLCYVKDIQAQKRMEQRSNDIRNDEIDEMTGLYSRAGFAKKMPEYLQDAQPGQYVLMAADIEKFKLFNEWYGEEEGNRFLIRISEYLAEAQREHGGLAAHIGGDDFVILLPNNMEILEKLQSQLIDYVKEYSGNVGFLPLFGVFVIRNSAMTFTAMYDRATLAIAEVKGNYLKRSNWYDSKMMKQIEKNQLLLSEIQNGIQNNEFVFYLQPQCNLEDGRILGMESLVRWAHPKRGIVSPGEFIPILEEHGLITNLDVCVWDQVCKWQRKVMDRGINPLPISVNVSRMDIYAMDIVKHFEDLIESYQLSSDLLEIEITESAYAGDTELIKDVVDRLREAGFKVLMDDFGSGYSSLNMVRDVNVNVLKFDMRFLNISKVQLSKGLGILDAIIRMARVLGLSIIAEGVETEDQIAFLREMGCRYCQGYYYYKPMPVDQMEKLLVDGQKIDLSGMEAQTILIQGVELSAADALSTYTNGNGQTCLWVTQYKYRSVMQLAGINSWEWNIEQNRLILQKPLEFQLENDDNWFVDGGEELIVENFPACMKEHKEMVPEHHQNEVMEFINKIRTNETDHSIYCEFPILIGDHNTIWVYAEGVTRYNYEGKASSCIGYYKDISDQKKQKRQLTRMAERDALTGFYNRQTAIPKIKKYLKDRDNENAALIMFDVDDFKLANDAFGHSYGDAIISEIAQRIRGLFRNNDIMCRIGGDEFLILCKDIERDDVENKLQQVMDNLVITYRRTSRAMTFTTSAGYVMIPEQGVDFDDLYEKADIALYIAKMEGKHSYSIYEDGMKTIRYKQEDNE